MVVLACIFTAVDFVSEFTVDSFIKFKCCNWLKRKRIDAVNELRAHENDIGSGKEIKKFKILSEAAYLVENRSRKNGIYIGLVVRFACAIAASICFGFFINQNLLEAMSAAVVGRDFKFQYVALIALGVIAVISFIATFISDSAYEKKYNAWYERNIIGDSNTQK